MNHSCVCCHSRIRARLAPVLGEQICLTCLDSSLFSLVSVSERGTCPTCFLDDADHTENIDEEELVTCVPKPFKRREKYRFCTEHLATLIDTLKQEYVLLDFRVEIYENDRAQIVTKSRDEMKQWLINMTAHRTQNPKKKFRRFRASLARYEEHERRIFGSLFDCQ